MLEEGCLTFVRIINTSSSFPFTFLYCTNEKLKLYGRTVNAPVPSTTDAYTHKYWIISNYFSFLIGLISGNSTWSLQSSQSLFTLCFNRFPWINMCPKKQKSLRHYHTWPQVAVLSTFYFLNSKWTDSYTALFSFSWQLKVIYMLGWNQSPLLH